LLSFWGQHDPGEVAALLGVEQGRRAVKPPPHLGSLQLSERVKLLGRGANSTSLASALME
jgi:hypothetical protein